MKPQVLVVEDDAGQARALADFLKARGFRVTVAATVAEACRARGMDLALVDLRLPDGDGLAVLQCLKRRDPDLPVVLMTAYASIESAVEAMKKGAYDYLTKPLDLTRLWITVQRALEHRALHRELRELREELQRTQDLPEIVARSPAMQEVLSLVKRVAPAETTVLITGESGTGKELVARTLHRLSGRKGRFVAVSVASLPDTLVEAELFGYERGAFTGADRARPGRFEAAQDGTLFLDEIGELSPGIQVKLLRVLQERTVERLGSNEPIPLRVRLVAATNQDLEALVRQGRFREDLYYRLNVVHIHLPPLRERREDIVPLAEHFLERFRRELHKPVEGFTREALYALLEYDWPGNVRELQNVIERAVVLTRHTLITPEDLALPTGPPARHRVPTLEEVEREHIRRVLSLTGGNLSEAARLLGIHRNTLRQKIRAWGLKPPSA